MRLAVIPGDGIGPEVIGEALKVLDEVAPDAEVRPESSRSEAEDAHQSRSEAEPRSA